MVRLGLRIHVNGIRGKSTVTRLIAGMLREAGTVTVAKTTGTEAAVIGSDGVDVPIERRGPATILEQIEIVRESVGAGTNALVIECMAINPSYQSASEQLIVKSNIGVLTNVREDHQDVMGETLPEIAAALLSTCPTNGVLITAERNPEIVPIILAEALRRGTRVLVADPDQVSDAELAEFDYVTFKDNVAIGLALADELGIDRAVAMRGMVSAPPDPGVHEHLLPADGARLAFVLGIIASLLMYERRHISTGSVVVPGYIGASLLNPVVVAITLVNAVIVH